ncbi:hypothetical protein LOD99_4181 [Oopsacas minuta]|uniref:AB hydrolase-1 domain-containing protein n=1 Tax=Oopsacas minuta TaxID=111878 RepID=A0AAV7JWT1_9METZ|nr:hypothetical protein LOD99_4181 [Oopsacas minuta]
MGTRIPYYLGRVFRIPPSLSERTSLLKWPLGWKGVVVHGGGGVAFTDTHPLVQHLTERYCSRGVHSIELPSHGSCASDNLFSAKIAKDHFYSTISTVIDSKTIVVSYSVGGIFTSSVWRSLCLSQDINPVAIFIGCHPRLVTRWPLISMYWSTPFTYLSQKDKWYQKKHCGDRGDGYQDYWKTTVKNTHDWLHPSSDIQADYRDLEFLKSKGMSAQWIIGDKDSAFPITHFQKSIDNKELVGGMERVMRIKSTHFNYFLKNWPHTQLAIDNILLAYRNSELEKS